ncbi:hypothetical protein DEU38_12531 [Rhodococcus sp. AG1013]|uniref:hypothetical protein n=1 Tax=Rhodococcus sp. AG1013 TaxID=2183996 RepID=UPI000E2CE300|nr:hypothetical protein [Rhodococcus sp. AG1013]RDI16668.1 hypothetical protein DEU38_12531 [Rhodococcus sp. AG1013]
MPGNGAAAAGDKPGSGTGNRAASCRSSGGTDAALPPTLATLQAAFDANVPIFEDAGQAAFPGYIGQGYPILLFRKVTDRAALASQSAKYITFGAYPPFDEFAQTTSYGAPTGNMALTGRLNDISRPDFTGSLPGTWTHTGAEYGYGTPPIGFALYVPDALATGSGGSFGSGAS